MNLIARLPTQQTGNEDQDPLYGALYAFQKASSTLTEIAIKRQ
jgi:hypothetical protein